MIFITEKKIIQNLKKYGFKTVKGDFTELINNIVYNFVYNVTKKAAKKVKNKKDTLTLSHFKQLQGGRVSLPGEYFGVASNHYVSQSNATDMSVTQDDIRPEMMTYRPGMITGGAENFFVISLNNVKSVLSEVLVELDLTNNMIKTDHSAVSKAFQEKLQDHLHKMFSSYVKKSSVKKQASNVADSKDFQSKVLLSIKKYSLYVRKI